MSGPTSLDRPAQLALGNTLSLELAYPNIYPTYDLLEYVKEVILLNHGHRITMTPDSSSISERNIGGGGHIMVVHQSQSLKPDQQLVIQ